MRVGHTFPLRRIRNKAFPIHGHMQIARCVKEPAFRANQQRVGDVRNRLRIATKGLLPGLRQRSEDGLPPPSIFQHAIPEQDRGQAVRRAKPRGDGARDPRDPVAQWGQPRNTHYGGPRIGANRGVGRSPREAIGAWDQATGETVIIDLEKIFPNLIGDTEVIESVEVNNCGPLRIKDDGVCVRRKKPRIMVSRLRSSCISIIGEQLCPYGWKAIYDYLK